MYKNAISRLTRTKAYDSSEFPILLEKNFFFLKNSYGQIVC